jgi:hypothetical protein
VQLAKSLLAGWGAFLFFRRVLGVAFWPAALGSWCYPMTAYFIVWQGFFLSATVAVYPWVLLAVDRLIRRPASAWGPGLAVLTALLLTIGATDIAALALLAAGLFALWRLGLRYGPTRRWGKLAGAGTALGVAWGVGFLLAAPYLLPLTEYVRTGSRMTRRGGGAEERPPGGLEQLPQTVLPLYYGSTQKGRVLLVPGNIPESAAAAYAGLLAALLLAPLGWTSRRHRALNLFWLVQAVLALAWVLNLPLLVPLMRSPGLNMLSFNRFTFAAAFAVVATAVVGLDVLRRGLPEPRMWYGIPILLLAGLAAWCFDRASALPEPLGKELEQQARAIPNPQVGLAILKRSRNLFRTDQWIGAGWCVAGAVLWPVLAWRRRDLGQYLLPLLGAAWTAELLVFAWDFNPQFDPALYYPSLPALQKLAALPPGRMLGLRCLPPLMNEICGRRDVRGYDAVDPRRIVELLETVKDPRFRGLEYAEVQEYIPLGVFGKDGRVVIDKGGKIPLPPALNMLNVRYVVGRGQPPPASRPVIAQDDYWVFENDAALPRAFVPAVVRPAPATADLLRLLSAQEFNPWEVAYAEDAPKLPGRTQGTVEVLDETPGHLILRADMQTQGLVVVADQWYEGWEATVDGQPVPVLRVNHALRGVVVPAGQVSVEFDYRPRGFRLGLRLLVAALGGLGLWAALTTRRRWPARRVLAPQPAGG